MATVRGNRALRSRALMGFLGVLASVILAGCTVQSPDASNASTNTPVTSTPTPTATETPGGPSAVVSLAGVDVDGLHLTVGGFVTVVAEDGGACAFDLTAVVSGAKVSAATVGAANGSNTSCGSTQIPVTQLTRGTWNVVLHYTSTKYDLVSEPMKVEVP